MSKLKTVADFERELASMDAVIADMSHGEIDFATEVSLRSMRARRNALARELDGLGDEQMAGHEIDLVFDGGPVRDHRLKAEFMGQILVKFQTLVRSTLGGNAQRGGRRGPLPDTILRASELQFAGSFEGSFGMRLETASEQLTLEGEVPIAETFRRLLAVVEAGADADTVIGRLADLGSARAITDYENFVKELSEEGASVSLHWANRAGQRDARIRATQATQLLATLQQVRETETSGWYVGTLDIGNSRHGRFGFTSDDGEQFEGVVEAGIVDQLREFYDRRCRAWIQTLTVLHVRSNLEKRSYRLQELQPLPDEKR